MKKYAFRKIFAIVLTTAMVFAFTVPVSATGAPEEVYTPTEVTVPEKAPDVPESVAEPTGEQLALIKDISVAEPTESVSETEVPVAPSDEAVIEEPLDEVAPEETIIEETITEEPNPEETVTEEPQEALSEQEVIETEIEQEEVVYNTSALTLDNLPSYILQNTLEKDVVAVGLAEDDMQSLSSFTTINEDETRTLYLFGDPIKYVDKTDNSLKFIDNSIIPITTENGGFLAPTVTGYKNGGNSYDLLMPNRINMGVRFTSDDISVLMTPAVASAAQGNLKSHSFLGITEQVVEYRNVFGNGIHLQYTPVNSGVKENIILDNYSGTNTFNFTISTGDYYPLYTEGEAIPFIDPTTDDAAFILGQVDARDSYTGEETDGHFTLYNSLSLTEIRPGLYTLTVTVDEEFLSDPDTVYPVIIDPTLTINPIYIYDTTVYSAMQNTQTFYSSAYNIVGNHGSSYGEGIALVRPKLYFEYHTYIWPDNVTSAKYKVYEGSGKTNSMTVQLCSTSAAWNHNTITYDTLSNLKSPTSSITISKSGWYNFNITDLYKNWLKYARAEGGYTYYRGFALKASTTGVSSKHFCSANYSGSLTPSMIITYNHALIFELGEIGPASVTSDGILYNRVPAWGKKITCDMNLYSFIVPVTADYEITTLRCILESGQSNAEQSSVAVYNSNLTRVTQAEAITPLNYAFSRGRWTLSPGTYYVYVSDNDRNAAYLNCYLIIDTYESPGITYIESNLEFEYSMRMKEFFVIGPETGSYNCFSYALGVYNQWINPSQQNNYLKEPAYTKVNGLRQTCVVVYSKDGVNVHYALMYNGVVTAKDGSYYLLRHPNYSAYYSTSEYGNPSEFYLINNLDDYEVLYGD